MTLLQFLFGLVAWRERRISFVDFLLGSPVPFMIVAVLLGPLYLVAVGHLPSHELGASYLAAAQALGICFLMGVGTLLFGLGLSKLARKIG